MSYDDSKDSLRHSDASSTIGSGRDLASSGVSADKAKGLLRRPWRNLCSIKLNQYLQTICYYYDMVLRLTRFYSNL